MTHRRSEKDKDKKRRPHWVVQLFCRRFNSAGPHPSSYKIEQKNERRRKEMRREGKRREEEKRREEKRREEKRREEKRRVKRVSLPSFPGRVCFFIPECLLHFFLTKYPSQPHDLAATRFSPLPSPPFPCPSQFFV